MCYVNYVRESTAFMRYACDQGLTANERLLWYALFDVMNARAKGSDWPEELIPIPNKRLLSLVPYGEDSMVAARNKLKQRGLIDFKPGKKNAAPPMYQLRYFYPELSTSDTQNVGVYTEISGKPAGNMQGNIRGNMQGNAGGNIGGRIQGIILNYKPNGLNRNPNDVFEDDDDAAAEYARMRAREEVIRAVFNADIGRQTTPAETQMLIAAWNNSQVDGDVVKEAIATAGVYGAKAPARYAARLIYDWADQDVKTMHDLVSLQLDGRVAKEE